MVDIGLLVVTLFVVEPEGFLELPPHLLLVLLDQELGCQLDKLWELELARPVLIDFLDDVVQVGRGHVHPHHLEDRVHRPHRDRTQPVLVELVERPLQGLDLRDNTSTLKFKHTLLSS